MIPNKEYFKQYRSNTTAGTCNNYILKFDEEKTVSGMIYYKVRKHGKANYRFLFSNTVDSTFADGSISYANLKGDEYTVIEAYAGDGGTSVNPNEDIELVNISFDGQKSKNVKSGEVFWSDEAELDIPEGHYLVFKWMVKGTSMAYTPDKIIPSFVKNDEGVYIENTEFPQPNLVGCDIQFEKNIAFLGDSITMGLQTTNDKYAFWVAKIAEGLGNDYSVWNIGLGYGRAQDAATKQVWLERAKQYDTVSVCFGVNDILQGRNEEQIINDLNTIVSELKGNGIKVSVFTVPAFDWQGEHCQIWDTVNDYIRNELSKQVDYWFDMAEATSKSSEEKYTAKYGGHPNDLGGTKIAEAFLEKYPVL